MDIKSLMIGDWVKCPTPFRVTGIYDDDPWVVYDEDGLPCELASVDPIPLTPETLEANGFRRYDDLWQSPKIAGIILDLEECDTTWYRVKNTLMELFYVHELQHALRLCGLGEIADNFKVK